MIRHIYFRVNGFQRFHVLRTVLSHVGYGHVSVTEATKTNVEMLSECNIEGMSAEWIKRGDYYYYTKVLKKQESVDLFQSVSVPAVWTEEHGGQKLKH